MIHSNQNCIAKAVKNTKLSKTMKRIADVTVTVAATI
jgi:hypothetical protein